MRYSGSLPKYDNVAVFARKLIKTRIKKMDHIIF